MSPANAYRTLALLSQPSNPEAVVLVAPPKGWSYVFPKHVAETKLPLRGL